MRNIFNARNPDACSKKKKKLKELAERFDTPRRQSTRDKDSLL